MRLGRGRMAAVLAVVICLVVLVGLSQRPDNAQAASVSALASPASALAARATAQPTSTSCQQPSRYRVQLHAHTGLPSAPVPAEHVVAWYRDHGFHAVSVTGLNSWVPPEPLQARFGEPGRFLVIGGTELSVEPYGVGKTIIDSLVIGIDRPVAPPPSTPQDSVTAVLDAEARVGRAEPGGQLIIAAHPGLTYAFQHRELVNSDRRPGPRYVERWNGESGMNFEPGGDWPGVERIVDRALAHRRIHLVATDDSHHFTGGPFAVNEHVAEPGRGWVLVRACALTWPSLLAAMERATSSPPRAWSRWIGGSAAAASASAWTRRPMTWAGASAGPMRRSTGPSASGTAAGFARSTPP